MTDRARKPYRAVTVSADGEQVLTIETNYLSGRPIIPSDENTINWAIDQLSGFIGKCAPTSPGNAEFCEMLAAAPLPWTEGYGRAKWSIIDATGMTVCSFDGSAPESKKLMAAIIVAVNTCGGFRAEFATPAAPAKAVGNKDPAHD